MERTRIKTTILVVDDNPENRALARATLEDEGYQVVTAASAEEGIAAFEADRPGCVLLDVRMPGTDGFAACARIRGLPGGADVPVIFLTALRDIDTFDSALRAGGDDFLAKPVRPTELVLRVQAALRMHRMSADLREHCDMVRRQRDDLLRVQLQKERLTAFVVHDLKNRVYSMDLHAQLLLLDPELSPRARDSVENVRNEARSLLRLVLNLLDISRSEEGRLSPRRADVDVAALLGEVAEAHALAARTAQLTFERDISATTVAADQDLLRRVIDNLIDNAIRHAPPHSAIHLSARRENGAVELRVGDSGPGVPTDMQEKIFERFVRFEGSEQLHGRTGRGLGLAFCKLAVEAHGGRIWLEEGMPGAVFCVRLPDAS